MKNFSWILCCSFIFGITLLAFDRATAQEAGAAKDDDGLNEQTIYIPYDKLREVFERDGRGVFLPYEKFQQLWKEAQANQPKPQDNRPPLGALITDIESIATLGKEIVTVDATVNIELLQEGWHRVPLRLNGAAIRSATLDGKPARVVAAENGQYELIVRHEGDEPQMIQLELSYARSLGKSGGQSTVAFAAPQAPVNRWTIRTGQKDIDVQIEPMIAASKKSNDGGADEDDDSADDDEAADPGDELLAFVGAAPEVKIIWTPKSEGAAGLTALVSAETHSQFQVNQGVARTSATVQLDISRAEIKFVSLTVPVDQKVVNVFDRNVKKWDVVQAEGDGDSQTVTVELFEPALGRQSLSLELEKFYENLEENALSVPPIAVNNISRNSGLIVVKLSGDLRAEPEVKTGLLQVDAAELPNDLKTQVWDFSYRYASLPFVLKINVKEIQPLINVEQLIEVAIRPEKLNVELSAIYDVQQAGVFLLNLAVPEELQIRDIRPLTRDGLENIPVDAFYRDANDKSRVIVTLGKKAIGKFGLLVSLDRELTDLDLQTPSETAAELALTIPKASTEDLEYSQGHVIVYSPESLQVNAAETTGLRTDSFENAQIKYPATMRVSDVQPRLAFSFSHAPAALKLTAKRRRPQVTVQQVVVVTIQSGVVKYDARLFYQVLYSGVKSLRLDVPEKLIDVLRNRTSNLLYQSITPQPENVPPGYRAWELTSNNEFFGKHEVRFTWEEKIADLPLGASATIAVERLIPADVDLSSGQIVLTKSETIDVRPNAGASGLRPIDPQTDLFNRVQIPNSALAFEFVEDWELNLTATRFELQELKQTSISRAVVRAVALRQNELSVQCLYQMRSVGQRISLQMPSGFDAETSFDDQPIRVNGRRVTPERGGKDLIYVPLTGQNSDTPFLLEVRYTIPGGPAEIALPVFTDSPAMQKVFLCVYLPHERALLHQSGPWTDEAIDENTNTIASFLNPQKSSSVLDRMFRRRHENVDNLLTWVVENVDCDSSALQKFEVDGRPYVFSALRPEPAPAGSLKLRTISMMLLNVLVCGLMVLVGLSFLRSRLTQQLAAGLFLLAALVLTGVFFPLVTEHLFGEALMLTAIVVGIGWLLFNARRWIKGIVQERRELQAERFQAALAGGIVADDGLNDVGEPPNERHEPTLDGNGGEQ